MTEGSAQRVLFIDAYPPMPDRNSGGLRTFEILRLMLSAGCDVTYLAQDVLDESQPYLDSLEAMGINTAVAPPNKGARGYVPDSVSSRTFDTVVIAFYTTAMVYLPVCRQAFPDAHLIVDTIDLHFLREERAAQVVGDKAKADKAEKTRRDELAIYSQADALWAITPVEQAILRHETSVADVAIVPNIHEAHRLTVPFEERSGLVFIGNFWHPPNTEAMVWFCHDILPLVRSAIPDITTTIVGANAQAKYFTEFETQGVRLAGWVPSLGGVLSSARLSIAPLLHGAGMKGKVGEALGAGLPVVTTSIGSEGMGLTHGVNVLVADSAEAFAQQIITAYNDEQLWNTLSDNGFGFMQANYTPSSMGPVVRAALLPTHAQRYLAVPDWSNEFAVKSVMDAYVRRFSQEAPVSLCLAVINHDLQAAAAQLTGWLNELGHDLEKIPDVELRPMTSAEVFAEAITAMWLPMGMNTPAPFTNVGALFPAHTI
jgi:glycosyltransferase involved in cell wall biosynthesis